MATRFDYWNVTGQCEKTAVITAERGDGALTRHGTVRMLRKDSNDLKWMTGARDQFAATVMDGAQDRDCAAKALGEVQEGVQEVRVSVVPRQSHEESRINHCGKGLTFP